MEVNGLPGALWNLLSHKVHFWKIMYDIYTQTPYTLTPTRALPKKEHEGHPDTQLSLPTMKATPPHSAHIQAGESHKVCSSEPSAWVPFKGMAGYSPALDQGGSEEDIHAAAPQSHPYSIPGSLTQQWRCWQQTWG